jgi:hypothetical protein
MKMSLDYVYEKFSLAIPGMATSPASIQERIADAYISQLIKLNEEDLPADPRFDFGEVQTQLTAREPEAGEGTVMATIRHMSEADATEIARKIAKIYDQITAAYHAEIDSHPSTFKERS